LIKPKNSVAQIQNVDVRQLGKVRIFVLLVDSTGTFYAENKQALIEELICHVIDTIDGQPTRVRHYELKALSENDKEPVAIAVVMDNSGSMGSSRASAVQQAARTLIDLKKSGDVLAFVRYDNHVVVEVPATSDKNALMTGLKQDGLQGFGGGTAVLSGTEAGIDHLAVAAGGVDRKAVVVFTDGQENSSTITKDQLIEKSLTQRIPIIAVDFGAGINTGYMQSIAEATGGSYHHIYLTSEFDDLFEDIYRRLRNVYVIEYETTKFGRHGVEVKLCFGRDSLIATTSYDNTPEVGSITLLDINFEHGSTRLTNTSVTEINHILDIMKANPSMTIELRGHTDNTNNSGDPNFNVSLSQKRADAVRSVMVNKGIDGSRITAKGFGETMPIASNGTEEGRRRNRRTEFLITAW